MKIDIVTVDDWEALYVDGVKELEGHSLRTDEVLKFLGFNVNHTYLEYNEDTETVEFADKIEDVKVEKYPEIED